MDYLQSFGYSQVFLFVLVIFFLLEHLAIAKGYLVKIEDNKETRLFWSILISLPVASDYFITGNSYSLVLALIVGVFVYTKKDNYKFRFKKS